MEVHNLTNPLAVYHQTDVGTASPDELGWRLFNKAYQCGVVAQEMIAQQKWDTLVNIGTIALQIFAAMADSTNQSTPEGEQFYITQVYAWRKWNAVLMQHDTQECQAVTQLAQNLRDQLGRRIGKLSA